MTEETTVPKKRQYKKAGPDDKRKETSKANLARARLKKNEILKQSKQEKEEEAKRDENQWTIQSLESDDSSSDSDSDGEVIQIVPKSKKKMKGGKKEKQESKNEINLQNELNEMKQILQGLTAKKSRGKGQKKQVIKIAPPVNPTPASKDPDIDIFKKILLSQFK